MNTKEPILLADGVRGIYATQHAATVLMHMIHTTHEFTYLIPSVNGIDELPAAAQDPEAEDQALAWDAVTRGTFYDKDGTEHRIHEDSEGIFLVPEGYELEQP